MSELIVVAAIAVVALGALCFVIVRQDNRVHRMVMQMSEQNCLIGKLWSDAASKALIGDGDRELDRLRMQNEAARDAQWIECYKRTGRMPTMPQSSSASYDQPPEQEVIGDFAGEDEIG